MCYDIDALETQSKIHVCGIGWHLATADTKGAEVRVSTMEVSVLGRE